MSADSAVMLPRPAEPDRSDSSLSENLLLSARLSALIVIEPALTLLAPIRTSAAPVSRVLIAAPLPAKIPTDRFFDVASKFCTREEERSRSPTLCTPRSPIRTSVVARIASLLSAPTAEIRPPLEALAR